jgi:prepilin-type N-terminal cleavage/methylation domain-containing protein
MTARGFTLIELSIVLVIIGLVVGGILVGQGLINAAALRAQITQIEKYNTAANTFREKYGYLPGDITATAAAQFGFAARGSLPGQGDGNGLLEGSNNNSGADGRVTSAGETVMFWADLGAANLIDQTFTTPSATASANCANAPMSACFPTAKISSTNYVYAWSGGYFSSTWMSTGVNYFGISSATSLAGEWGHGFHSNADGPTGLCARQQNG